MDAETVFIDTNILIYAADDKSISLLNRLTQENIECAISPQIIREYLVVITRERHRRMRLALQREDFEAILPSILLARRRGRPCFTKKLQIPGLLPAAVKISLNILFQHT